MIVSQVFQKKFDVIYMDEHFVVIYMDTLSSIFSFGLIHVILS